jgi:hypothetical protein
VWWAWLAARCASSPPRVIAGCGAIYVNLRGRQARDMPIVQHGATPQHPWLH